MIDSVLVDIGNVLLRLRCNPIDALLSKGRVASCEIREVREELNRLYCCFESGQIHSAQFVEEAMELTKFVGNVSDFEHTWCDIFDLIPEMWEWCRGMKARGMRLVLFSNTNELHRERFLKYPNFCMFEEAIYSDFVGQMKPESGMYREAIDRLSLVPSRTLYVDDLKDNVETGRKFGFCSYLFRPSEVSECVSDLDLLCK